MIKVFMEGRVAKDAQVFEYGGTGRNAKTGVSWGMICNRFYGDENPTFISCTIFGADEKLAQYITTGKQLIVLGTLSRNQEGYYSVTVQEWSFGAVPKRDQNGGGQNGTRQQGNNRQNGGNNQRSQNDIYSQDGYDYPQNYYDGIDEELPFN